MADMTNIFVIHPPVGAEGAQRLLGTLRRAHADGTPLGSRTPHIRALCLSLEKLLTCLRSTMTTLMQDLDDHELCTDKKKHEFTIMVAQIERLITHLRAIQT